MLDNRNGKSRCCRTLIAVVLLLLLLHPAPSTFADESDPRYFAPTGFRISDDRFWDYFNRRGGLDAFGYPVSRAFTLQGFRVQIFQRRILQQQPDGRVTQLNFLDDMLPYTHINGSAFPALDPALVATAPPVSDPQYATKVLEYVRQHAPDTWDGVQVNFYHTFLTTISAEEAFPADGDPSLLPLINLELWGVPVSAPQRDPTNPKFIYLRFQRGVMHYDASTGQTLGLLLADYFKAVLTGKGLPPDLAEAAQNSIYYKQYAPGQPNALARPAALPGTDLTNAFEQDAPLTSAAIAIRSYSTYRDAANVVHIVGEVQNTSGGSFESVEVSASLGAAATSSYVLCDILGQGEKAPFHLLLRNAGNGTPVLQVRALPLTSGRVERLLHAEGTLEAAGANRYRVHGTVTNTSGTGVRRVGVAITLYDAGGKVTGVALAFALPSDLQPNATGTFDLTLDTASPATALALRAEGY